MEVKLRGRGGELRFVRSGQVEWKDDANQEGLNHHTQSRPRSQGSNQSCSQVLQSMGAKFWRPKDEKMI